ncbi:MAG: hypothetical protein M1839_006622 [Geoglossum umbratile]|nr:MAG: hypothetical protein M1839_006622 [Geoglossum umbratile]
MNDQMQWRQSIANTQYATDTQQYGDVGQAPCLQPPLEALQYYYDYIDSDDAVYWALKDEFKDSLGCPQTYLVRLKPKPQVPNQNRLKDKASNDKVYYCLSHSCGGTFTRKADLERHIATIHKPNAPRFDCPLNRCHRKGEDGFTREDHLNEHLRNYHSRYIPKRGERQ